MKSIQTPLARKVILFTSRNVRLIIVLNLQLKFKVHSLFSDEKSMSLAET